MPESRNLLAAPSPGRMPRGRPDLDVEAYRQPLTAILREVEAAPRMSQRRLDAILRRHPMDGRGLFPRDVLLRAYRAFAGQEGLGAFDPALAERFRIKPARSRSGVSVVTVLTKPFPCPGECVFCPSDLRMPKSYLADEPGAQRAERNAFDPYLQTWSRLAALDAMGHPVDKVELIVLGGTWSFYPEGYQIWFVKRLFDALRDFGRGEDGRAELRRQLRALGEARRERVGSDAGDNAHPASGRAGRDGSDAEPVDIPLIDGTRIEKPYNAMVQEIYAEELRRAAAAAADLAAGRLVPGPWVEHAGWAELEAAQRGNETERCRSVGLVVETRPDRLDAEELVRIRRLGATKVQIGVQSTDDRILALNRRGHDLAATRRAFGLLRRAGFKIHAHWMPNLLGATPESDREDFLRLFSDPELRPDELKIYPCMLIESAELMRYHEAGEWRAYDHEALVSLLADCVAATPEYCRITRIVRDIPSPDIVEGNRRANLRQLVDARLSEEGRRRPDIRAREVRARDVRGRAVEGAALVLDEMRYATGVGDEVFLQYVSDDAERRIAGFLRLALPRPASTGQKRPDMRSARSGNDTDTDTGSMIDVVGAPVSALALESGSEPGPDVVPEVLGLPRAHPLLGSLEGAAIIREVHVYGQALGLGESVGGSAQHQGLGTGLVERAAEIAAEAGFARLAVISAVGTREYYRKLGFVDAGLYPVRPLG